MHVFQSWKGWINRGVGKVTIKITLFLLNRLSRRFWESEEERTMTTRLTMIRAMPSTSSVARTDMRRPINTIPSNSRSTSSVVFASSPKAEGSETQEKSRTTAWEKSRNSSGKALIHPHKTREIDEKSRNLVHVFSSFRTPRQRPLVLLRMLLWVNQWYPLLHQNREG